MPSTSGFLHADRLFPSDPTARNLARDIYDNVADLAIISPHGHTEPAWFADDQPFSDAASLLVTPDHYLFRMLHSRGLSHDQLGLPRLDGSGSIDPRDTWRLLARSYHLFAGTPSRLWVDHAMSTVLGCEERLCIDNADLIFDHINAQLKKPEFRPRALFQSFNIETIATTEGALDPLPHHQKLLNDGWIGRIRTTYRPDAVTDPEAPNFSANLLALGYITNTDVRSWDGMIEAHRRRRSYFKNFGATATDHGTPSALTLDLPDREKQRLLNGALANNLTVQEAEFFRAQMLTEMAGLSVEDGMVMQIHAGSKRSTDRKTFTTRGPNMGSDIPLRTDWVGGLDAMLNRYGDAPNLRVIAFTLDETTYARELAPMAGHWPCLLIGPPWWFHDSPNGIRRYLDQVVETAGYYNLAGFNDDTRALLSIPARHDVWRREVSSHLANMTAEHRIDKGEALIIARKLCYDLSRDAYRLS